VGLAGFVVPLSSAAQFELVIVITHSVPFHPHTSRQADRHLQNAKPVCTLSAFDDQS
jgi:hypothetical protein